MCITPRANMREMMETAQTIAGRFHGELIVAYVKQAKSSPEDQAALDEKLAAARAAGAQIEILEGEIRWRRFSNSPDPAESRSSSSGTASVPESGRACGAIRSTS